MLRLLRCAFVLTAVLTAPCGAQTDAPAAPPATNPSAPAPDAAQNPPAPPPSAATSGSVYPSTAYPVEGRGYSFKLLGDHFDNAHPENNDVQFVGQGSILDSSAPHLRSAKECARAQQPCLWLDTPQELHVEGYKVDPKEGLVNVQAYTNGQPSTGQIQLVLAKKSPAQIRTWSIATFVVLLGILFLLVRFGLKTVSFDGRKITAFEAVFLDNATDTYSLSKFQLFAFSGSFLACYLYVFYSHWFAQWTFELPNIPGSFATLLGASTATSVLAAGLTSSRGDKGAGQVGPSLSDFITSGGMVVPERALHFTWTIIACFGLIVLTFSQDPAILKTFPDIPPGVLYIMGITSGGYLAGKLSRLPGPIIRSARWSAADPADPGVRTLTLAGDNLSTSGEVFMSGVKLKVTPAAAGPPSGTADPTLLAGVTLDPVPAPTANGTLRFINPDGQFADFVLPPA